MGMAAPGVGLSSRFWRCLRGERVSEDPSVAEMSFLKDADLDDEYPDGRIDRASSGGSSGFR